MHKEGGREWYEMSVEDVVGSLHSDSKHGLTPKEAEERILRDGENTLRGEAGPTLLDRISGEIRNPLTFTLLVAGIITTFLAHYVDATVIFIALIINIAISLYQEGRADKAFQRLKESQEKFTVVLRGGEKMRIASSGVVKGDILIVETGMHVPADARIISGNNIEVNESPLTGEWIDVGKHSDALPTLLPPGEQKNMLFMGTLLTGGSGRAIVVRTGNDTLLGTIATALGKQDEQTTPLQRNFAEIAKFISYIVLGALIGIFVLGLFRGMPVTELFLVSIAVAVAAIPEGLPSAVTVVLAIGMEAILRRGGLVRNLLAAETLGSTTIILTDKTGTLTRAEMTVARVVTLGSILLKNAKKESAIHEHEAHGDERDILQFSALASDAFIEMSAGGGEGKDVEVERVVRGRPVERAIVEAALRSGLDQRELLANYPRIDFFPFESKHRVAFSLNHVRGIKHNRLYITGAPEFILERAGAVYLAGRTHIMTDEIRADFESQLKEYTKEGMRLIGVAFRDTTLSAFKVNDEEFRAELLAGVIFGGFIALHDPLRDDVAESIRIAKEAGARVVMATGDNIETARTIAKECGIWKEGDHALSGEEVARADDAVLLRALRNTSVFARVLPEHKLRLARLLSGDGEIVAMTGDGVNDAPALRAANIGVALGSGTEVAKEASDLILETNSFSVIVSAIEEGRRIVDNLRKIVAYLLSTSFSEIILVGGALIFGLPLPLLPAQILWTNMLSEGFMNFAFAFEPKEDDVMKRDPRIAGAMNMLTRPFIAFILAVGVMSGALLLGLYFFAVSYLELSESASRTIMFIALTLGTTSISFSLKDLRSPLYSVKFTSNKYLLGSLLFALLGLLLALEVPFLSGLLRLAPISYGEYAPIFAGYVIATLFSVEVIKYLCFERRSRWKKV